MEKISKLHYEAFDEKDDSQLKEFALDCFDRALCQNKGQSCNSEKKCWKPYFPLQSQKVSYY